jgi:hypothetical protein
MMSDDPNALKGTEALYSLTKAAFDAEFSRYDAAEAKAGRYLNMLGLIIGVSVLKVDDAVWVWRHAPTWVAMTFVVAAGLTVLFAIGAFVLSVRAMSIETVPAIPVGEEIENLFRGGYKEALDLTTESFRNATRKLRDTTSERSGCIENINRLVKWMMWTGAATLLIYVSLMLTALNAVQP